MCQASSYVGCLSLLYSQSCPMEEASRGGEALEGRSTASPEGLQSKEINDHSKELPHIFALIQEFAIYYT